jgi:antitoxin component YwqK of YwqJK toxin-antitoxin module
MDEENLKLYLQLNPQDKKELLEKEINPLQRFTVIDEALLKNIQVLYIIGFSASLYEKTLKPWLEKDSTHTVIFLEDDLSIIKALIHSKEGNEILKDPQTYIFSYNENSLTTLVKRLSHCFYNFNHFIISIDESHKQWAVYFESLLSFWNTVMRSIHAEYENYSSQYFNNYYANIQWLPLSYQGNQLFQKFQGIPAIICGAGPSLDKNLKVLETLADKALIFAGGTALNAVNSNGFVPHFGLGIDPNLEQYTRLIMNTAFELPFFYRNRLYLKALPLIQGPLLYVTGSPGYDISKYFESKLQIEGEELDEGFNVVNFSLNLAYHLGCNPIILVGLDLSYSDLKSYQSGVMSHPTHLKRQDFKTKTNLDELLVKNDIYGNPTYTLWKWVAESDWISRFANKAKDRIFLNATEGGIGVKDIPNVSLKEVADEILTKSYDLNLLVHGHIQNSSMPKDVTKENVTEICEELLESLNRCENYLNEKNDRFKEEIGYTYVLKNFENYYQDLKALENLKYEKELHTEEDRVEREKKLENELYNYLKEAAKINALLIKFSLLFDESPVPSFSPVSPEDETVKMGLNTFYSKEGKLLGKSFFKDGKREGEVKLYYSNGSLYSLQHYKNGLKEGEFLFYYPDGKIKTHLNYKENLLDGENKLFYPNGQMKRELFFSRGKRDGKERMWSKEGVLQIEVEYSENIPQGVAKTWYPEGLIAQEIEYEGGKAISIKRWDKMGLLIPDEKIIQEDFFDKVTSKTFDFSKSLENVFLELNKLYPLMNLSSENFEKDFKQLNEEFLKLGEINKLLQIESKESPIEAIWKSPQTEKQLKNDIQMFTENLSQELKNLQDLIKKIKNS